MFRKLRPVGRLDSESDISGQALEGLVYQHLCAYCDYSGYENALSYWRTSNGAEVDFVVERQGCLSAVEVKWGENTRARSLASLRTNKTVDRLVRISAKPFGNAGGMMSVPLYATHCL